MERKVGAKNARNNVLAYGEVLSCREVSKDVRVFVLQNAERGVAVVVL